MNSIKQNPPRSFAETPLKDSQSANEETLPTGFSRAINSVDPKNIPEEKKSKPANVSQHKSLISRKIEQLDHQGRSYLLQGDKPFVDKDLNIGNTPIESST